MQQHISVEMLNELSPEARERLRTWWKPQWGDVYWLPPYHTLHVVTYCDETGIKPLGYWPCYRQQKSEVLPLLSIGQLIELLSQRGRMGLTSPWPIPMAPSHTTWRVSCSAMRQPDKTADEPIHALWDAAKAVLGL